MNLNFNSWHPLPRYGLAAALYQYERAHGPDVPKLDAPGLIEVAKEAMLASRFGFLLRAQPGSGPSPTKIVYQEFNDVDILEPGKKSGQNSVNGYFLAPHVLTSNNSVMLLKEMVSLAKALDGSLDKSYQLKRSFSPLTSKINAGRGSMSDPKDEVLQAAFTAVAAATRFKAAALDYDAFTNIGLIPDLPLIADGGEHYPLVDYVRLLAAIQDNLGDANVGNYDPEKSKYLGRPRLYRGNFQYALNNVNFGSLQLVAALSRLLEVGTYTEPEAVRTVLRSLADQPIYIFGYDVQRQEQFGTHLVDLTADGVLYTMLENIWKVSFYDVKDEEKFKNRKWIHFKRNLDRWLRRFDAASFQGFLAQRAQYPPSFLHPFKAYFMHDQTLSPDVVNAAIALGQSINRAAYFIAKDKANKDRVTQRDINEYKTRVLASIESNIRSATEHTQLLSQLTTTLGRMTNHDVDAAAAPFMRAVALGEVDLDRAKHLLTAFMRLNSYGKRAESSADNTEDDIDVEAALSGE